MENEARIHYVAETLAKAFESEAVQLKPVINMINSNVAKNINRIAEHIKDTIANYFLEYGRIRAIEIMKEVRGESPEYIEMVLTRDISGAMLVAAVLTIYLVAFKSVQEE